LLENFSKFKVDPQILEILGKFPRSWGTAVENKKLSCRWQTARRICANTITWLDLTSVIEICLKKNRFIASGLLRSLEVIGTDTDRSAICDFLLVFYSNFDPKNPKFLKYSTSKMLW